MHELNFKRNIFLFATNDMHQQNMLGLIYVSTTIVNYDRENIFSVVRIDANYKNICHPYYLFNQ